MPFKRVGKCVHKKYANKERIKESLEKGIEYLESKKIK